jgi:hypothetical protein
MEELLSERSMPVNRQRLRELLQELEPTIALVFGSGWKTHTHWGLLASGDFRIETLDGRKIKRLIFSPTGKIRWKGLASDDKNREELQMFKTRSLMRIRKRVSNESVSQELSKTVEG